jgi:hypothetical protein
MVPAVHAPASEVPSVHLGAALLALPAAATALAGTALTETGLQVFGSVSAAIILAAFALVWRAIKSSNAHEVEAIVRRVVREEMANVNHRLDRLEDDAR